ncbi:kelch-like protein 1 [Anastrepha obliqua]|uniref:kelch-like protein 1 n=1 Tax=Anastrepha obliqua TaxID=95512 RepID=UPI00240A63DA|nr:kelch-like protein 1 [Anastrepha obliqua]XP_054730542.1 kelch-like protein 1 [Anastrepha obliqua]XP_054730543.1 kelch-like protein 1 [Anastrepha obliqua]
MDLSVKDRSDLQHNWEVMQQVYTFYNEQKFTDILFEFSNTDYAFSAHRLILAGASPYLMELFDKAEPDCTIMTITDMDSDTFEQLVIFCYNGQTDITAGNAERMIRGAVTLRLDGVIDVCVSYLMAHIDDFLLRKLIALEADIKCEKLETRLMDYVAEHFKKVINNNEIFGLSPEQWKIVMKKVDVSIVSQFNISWAIIGWYKYKSFERQQYLPALIGTLRLTEFNDEFILNVIKPLPGCEQLATEVIKKRANMNTWFAVQRVQENWTGPKTILQLNLAKEEWEKVTIIDMKRYFFWTAFMESKIFFIGGTSVFGYERAVDTYDLVTKAWNALPRMQEHRVDFCVALQDKNIYAIGGQDRYTKYLQTVERFDVSASKWHYAASLAAPRAAAGTAVLNDYIYVIGGSNGTQVNTVERYHAATNRWTACRSMIAKIKNPAVAVHQEFIYVMGGLGNVERYDPRRDEWTKIARLNIARRHMCAESIGGQLWVFGGTGSTKMDDTVEVYDVSTDQWQIKKALPETGVYSCFPEPTKLVEKLKEEAIN